MRSALPPAAAPVVELIGRLQDIPDRVGRARAAIGNIKAMDAIRDPSNCQGLTAKLLVDATQGHGHCAGPLPAAAARARAEALLAAPRGP